MKSANVVARLCATWASAVRHRRSRISYTCSCTIDCISYSPRRARLTTLALRLAWTSRPAPHACHRCHGVVTGSLRAPPLWPVLATCARRTQRRQRCVVIQALIRSRCTFPSRKCGVCGPRAQLRVALPITNASRGDRHCGPCSRPAQDAPSGVSAAL